MTRTTAVKHVINIWKVYCSVHFYILTLLCTAQLSVFEQWLLIGSYAAYINNTVMNVLYVQKQETAREHPCQPRFGPRPRLPATIYGT